MKKVVRHLLIASILFFFSGNSIAQSACNWKQGDMVTYDQGDYGDAADPAVTLLLNNYNTVYCICATH